MIDVKTLISSGFFCVKTHLCLYITNIQAFF
jgi:hypothetical protein